MKFIVNYRNFIPIREGLESSGYTVYENLWNPTDEQLQDCDGYLLDMYDAMKRPWDTLRLKSRLRQRRIPLIGWNRDAPWNKGAKRRRLWWFRKLRVLDIYMAHSLQGAAAFTSAAHYLPNAAWVARYNLAGRTLDELRDSQRYRYDVSFVGTLDAQKYPEFTERAKFFAELERRLTGFGVSMWFRHGKNMPLKDQIELIQRSRINLNFGAACDDGPEKSWGLPERCYGVPACGGFLLSETREHAARDFDIGKEWVDFSSMEDCVGKVRHYLANFPEVRAIAEQAHRRVLREHTYEHRARTMVAAAREWKARAQSRAAPAD
ncbi:MAG: glycosyltransferase [Sulfuricaulis sp.]|uniref:glycosyltransferase family protein n=1 Tax=Sulfuricaulis sp. TaxID=2003553 RepID=UPI0025E08DD5|nr:glycosyltransferase [Sulfuricaulis sp.]MCR4347747.1 glycosyltransferase [Sulfuricaulis sp.]